MVQSYKVYHYKLEWVHGVQQPMLPARYALSTGYKGNAGDGLTSHNGHPFSTRDRDNDAHSKHCAVSFKGAWWYYYCHESNLNGLYLSGSHSSFADGVNWYRWKGHRYSLKISEMKVRRV